MILSPSAWAVRPEHDNAAQPYGREWVDSYTALARLYDLAVVGVSNVGTVRSGPWKGWKCIGCSLAVGPGGTVLARGPYGESAEELLLTEFTAPPRPAAGTQWLEHLRGRGYEGI